MLKEPAEELELVSAYFVPGRQGVDHFVGMARGGVKVTVLTNALEATDVAAVHAGYAKRRRPLLEAGITLFELKRMARTQPTEASGPRRELRFQPSREDVRDRPLGRVRRLFQLRPALGSAQHGARVRHRQPGPRDGARRPSHRTARRPIVPGSSGTWRCVAVGGPDRRQGGRAQPGARSKPVAATDRVDVVGLADRVVVVGLMAIG